MSALKYHALRVVSVIEETADARSLVFDVPPALADTFHYRPGQFLTLRLPVDGKPIPRCYSLASSPSIAEPLRVTVKRVAQGVGSNWVCDSVREGDEIEVQAPAGVFCPKDLNSDFLLLGGGSGITPILSILRSALTDGSGRILLVYANRDERSIIFKDALKALAAAHPDRLQVVHWLDTVQGIPSVAQLAALARAWRHADCFICGPSAFMDAAVQALQSLEIDAGQVHVERFASLPDESELGGADILPTLDDGVALEVTLDGKTHHLTCGKTETLLDAMLRGGVDAPYACRAGACATCMCTVDAGAVRMKHNDVLDKNDLAQGWTLACQAIPQSGQVAVRFPE
ncbi:3-ketosteroid-9-alpha-hydroxylase [Pandoraea vervacti]|uniref:3-ketosteroid-9-alpha-hydroxylase n=1 Tax=Pandoraea vervacti TaxID=656178 RepID=A0ABN4FMS7_9BURK|nr:ferredoxin--NADP reductase [Pandoraea vervacti]AJP56790.1 3-ketosteroid-9-alpha-hydroxylase [Pandoraea vervacti]